MALYLYALHPVSCTYCTLIAQCILSVHYYRARDVAMGVLILNFISSVGGSGRSVATNLILFFKRDNGNFICLV